MSDQWETFCDVGYYHMWRLRRKTERGWNDGFHINTRDEAEGLCELLNKLEGELASAKEQCSNLDDQVSSAMMVIRGMEREHDEAREQIEANHKATLVIERMFYEAREQRDRLAEAARTLPDYDAGLLNDFGGGDAGWWQDYIRAEIGRANEYWRAALAAVEGRSAMSRTHDVTISAFDLDRLEAQLDAVTEQRDRLAEVLNDLWHHYSLTGAAYELIEKSLAAVEGDQP